MRINERGELIVSVAVPIQRYRSVHGALLLSTQGGDIDAIVHAERLAIVRVFLVAAGVTVRPVDPARRHHRGAAPPPRRRRRPRPPRRQVAPGDPRFQPAARDEIGHLSQALRDMTSALYNRIDAIESFAADVAHELKNPLTSLRSAVETLPLAKTEEAKARLAGDHPARRAPARPADQRHLRRLAARRRTGAPGRARRSTSASCSTTVVAHRARHRRRPTGRRSSSTSADDEPSAYVVARPRQPPRPGLQQPDRQCPLLLPQGRHRARRGAADERRPSRSSSRTTGPASAPTSSSASSSASTPTAPEQEILRPEFRPRPVHLAADRRGASRPHLGREPHQAEHDAGRRAGGARRALHGAPAARHERATRPSMPARSLVGEQRRADPRRFGQRQVVALLLALITDGSRAQRARRRRPRRRSRSQHGRLVAQRSAGARRPDRGARPGHPRRRPCLAGGDRPGRRSRAAGRVRRACRRRTSGTARSTGVCAAAARPAGRRAWRSARSASCTALVHERNRAESVRSQPLALRN